MRIPLCKVLFDGRKGKAREAVFCPVGDENQLKEFLSSIRQLENYDHLDYFFIYRQGLNINPKSELFKGLSVLHAEEKIPIGSSGVFFIGSYALFQEGYEIIMIADSDAIPNSNKILPILLNKAYETQKAAVPLNNSKENTKTSRLYMVNHWGTFPRSVFEKIGFYTIYTWRGGEDYDFTLRLIEARLLLPVDEVCVVHPRTGYTIFHKMVEKKKFYPYAAGLMKVFLFHSEKNPISAIKFILWYVFYAFFGDIFSDRDMFMMLSKCNRFTTEYSFTNLINNKVEVTKVKERGPFPGSFFDKITKEARLLLNLLLFKRAEIYIDEITLKISRIELLLGILKAFIFLPLRFIQAIFALITWQDERKKVVHPINTKNVKEAIKIYEKFIIEKKL